MRSNTSHRTTFVQVVNHVQDKSIVGCLAWCKSSCLTETVIGIEFVGSTPFGRERRICYNSIKLGVAKGIPFKCITVFYLEIAELNAVKQHIHSSKIVGCRILFLSVNIYCIANTCSTKQQRAATASRVIDIAQTLMSYRDDFCQDTADFLRSIEFSGFLSGSCSKL